MIKCFCDKCSKRLPDDAVADCCGDMLCINCYQQQIDILRKEIADIFPPNPRFKPTNVMKKHLLEPGKVQLIRNGYFYFNGFRFTLEKDNVVVDLLIQDTPVATLRERMKIFKGDSLTVNITEGRMKVCLEAE